MRMRGLEPPRTCIHTDLNRARAENMRAAMSVTSRLAGLAGRRGRIGRYDCCQTVATEVWASNRSDRVLCKQEVHRFGPCWLHRQSGLRDLAEEPLLDGLCRSREVRRADGIGAAGAGHRGQGLPDARAERLVSEGDGSATCLLSVVRLRCKVLRVIDPEDQDAQHDDQRSYDQQYERHRHLPFPPGCPTETLEHNPARSRPTPSRTRRRPSGRLRWHRQQVSAAVLLPQRPICCC
jgi:hypothetical protein